MWGRTGPAISSTGVMYTGTGDGRWDPETGIYGTGIIGGMIGETTLAMLYVPLFFYLFARMTERRSSVATPPPVAGGAAVTASPHKPADPT